MSSNVTTLDWQSTKAVISTVQTVLDFIFIYGNAAFQAICVVHFGCRFWQKDPMFLSAYYYILVCGYTVMSSTAFLFKIYSYFRSELRTVYGVFRWYNNRFYAVKNTVLALNRFTGIFFYFSHKKIWETKWLGAVMAGLFLYPILLTAHTLGDIYCFTKEGLYFPACTDFFTTPVVLYSNMVNGCLALVFGISTALARKIKGQEWAKKEKYETYLLVQSIVSTLLLLISEIFSIIATDYELAHAYKDTFGTVMSEWITYYVLWDLCNWVGLFYHSSSAVLIICLSKPVRDSFNLFYRLHYIPGIKKPHKHVIMTPVQSWGSQK